MKLLEFNTRFNSEESCEECLKEQRERNGLKCPHCGGESHKWDKYNKCWICKDCGHKTTLTAGTMMHGSKLPLLYWFTAMHLLTTTKRTFSAKEMQHQLGHKRYQPIWEMMHKLRSVMGKRDDLYSLTDTVELDEGYFSICIEKGPGEDLKRGIGSQRKAKVLVLVESEPDGSGGQGKKSRKCGHLKMQVIEDLKSATFEEEVGQCVSRDATVVMDNLAAHKGVEAVVAQSERQTVPGKDAPRILPWVHMAIANAKSQLQDMFHGVKANFLQGYLNEFCYRFNRKYFRDNMFDRLMIAAVSYRPSFQHRTYRQSLSCG